MAGAGFLLIALPGHADINIDPNTAGALDVQQTPDGVAFTALTNPLPDPLSLGADRLYVGNTHNGELLIDAGSELSSSQGEVGFGAGSVGGVTVTGAGSTWVNGSWLHVGRAGTGTLDIFDGASVTGNWGVLGLDSGATGTATINGIGSSWTNNSDLTIGSAGNGTLNIQAGGLVSNVNGFLGVASSSSASATVTGAGSIWVNSGELTIGSHPNSNATLTIQGGGAVSSTRSFIGVLQGTNAPSVTVTGTNSTWTHTLVLHVGYFSDATLRIEDGGAVIGGTTRIGTWAASTSTATVHGAGSTWTNTSQMQVGFEGNGTLNIEAGGTVENNSGFLGFRTGSTGTATVSGAGSMWTNNNDLYVGGGNTSAGGTGTLHLEAGGTVDVTGTTRLWSTGTVNLSGGTLITDTVDHTDGGVFNFTAGTLSTSTFDGDLLNQGGTLAPGQSPGTTTINGGYTQQTAGTLAIEIGGTTQGTQFDFVDVNGLASLAGTLDVVLTDAFDPSNGDRFDILDWDTLAGTFDSVVLPGLSGGLSWDLSDLYLTGELAVALLLGDYSGDGFVGAADLDVLLANWGDIVTPGDLTLGDGSGDGAIGNADLQLVLDHWGSGTLPDTNIPEPGSLAVMGLVGLMIRRRRCW